MMEGSTSLGSDSIAKNANLRCFWHGARSVPARAGVGTRPDMTGTRPDETGTRPDETGTRPGPRPDPLRAGTVPARASVGTLPGQGGGGPGVSGYALDPEPK